MIRILISGEELYDESTEEFINMDSTVVDFEHSLVSLSKWESIFEKPFLDGGAKTSSDIMAYIKCMIIDPNIDTDLVHRLSQEQVLQINDYIASNQTATTFGTLPEKRHSRQGERITSELIYFWMVSFQIPFECETWHLNRLFSLIQICNLKNSKPRKINAKEAAAQRRALNDERRAKLGTTG